MNSNNKRIALTASVEIKPLLISKCWQGRRYRTCEYKKYTEEVLHLLPKKEMVEGQVGLFLTFYIKNPRQCDLDNFLKPMLDILVKKEYIKDDRYIYFLQAQKIKSSINIIKIEIVQL